MYMCTCMRNSRTDDVTAGIHIRVCMYMYMYMCICMRNSHTDEVTVITEGPVSSFEMLKTKP